MPGRYVKRKIRRRRKQYKLISFGTWSTGEPFRIVRRSKGRTLARFLDEEHGPVGIKKLIPNRW